MGLICSYIRQCCCGCCIDNKEEELAKKRNLRTQQRKNLKLLKDITPSSSVKPMASPLDVKTTEMTDFYKIPSTEYKNEEAVLKSMGYVLGHQIDSGGFASVHLAFHLKRGLKVAAKKIPIPEAIDAKSRKKRLSLLTDIKNELYVLQKIDHPNVIKMILHFIIVNKNVMTFYILMQFAPGGNLSTKLDESGPFAERQCKRWFAQILSGLKYMHFHKIAHRDLKLANILLDEAQDVLISDFGLSRLVWRESAEETLLSKTYCGTPPYMAPEVLEIPFRKRDSPEYNAFTADIWSCGIILFKLYNKRYPFGFGRGPAKAIAHMKAHKWRFAKRTEQPTQPFADLMAKLLESSPDKRINMETLVAHPWIRKEFNSVEEKNSKKMAETRKTK